MQLAQSCGFTTGEYNAGDGTGRKIPFVAFDGINMLAALEQFAAMVAATEREACAISCEVNAARWIDDGGKMWSAAHECADAIRARNQGEQWQ